MLKQQIEHSCGHTATHGLTGSARDQELRANWLARQLCPDCWRAQQSAGAAAQREAAALPPLTGNEDQVPWAEVLRMKVLAHNREYVEQLKAEGAFEEDPELCTAAMQTADAAMRELEAQTEAQWWLDHRFDTLSYVKWRIVERINQILAARETSGQIE